MLKIAIIIGSTRPVRNAEAVAKWVSIALQWCHNRALTTGRTSFALIKQGFSRKEKCQ